MAVVVWNQSLGVAGAWIVRVAVEFLAKRTANGVMHNGVRKGLELGNDICDYPAATCMAGINRGGQCSCVICSGKGEAQPGTSTYRMTETHAPLRTASDWACSLEGVLKAKKSVLHVNGVQRQVNGKFPLAMLPGFRPVLTTLPDYMHSQHGYGGKKMLPCYISGGKHAEKSKLRPTKHIPEGEVNAMNAEMHEIARPMQYKRPIYNLRKVREKKMMQTSQLILGEFRLLVLGRIDSEDYEQMVANYIVPLCAGYGYGGEVVLEDTEHLFQFRFAKYIEFVKLKLGIGYISPVLHNLTHGHVIAQEAGGFRHANVARFESGIWCAGDRIHGSRGQEAACLRGLATAPLLCREEMDLPVLRTCLVHACKTQHAFLWNSVGVLVAHILLCEYTPACQFE